MGKLMSRRGTLTALRDLEELGGIMYCDRRWRTMLYTAFEIGKPLRTDHWNTEKVSAMLASGNRILFETIPGNLYIWEDE